MSQSIPQRLSEIEAEIRQHEQALGDPELIRHAWEIGRLLTEAKPFFENDVAYGKWAKEKVGFARTWRWSLMRLAEYPFSQVNGFENLTKAIDWAVSQQQPPATAGVESPPVEEWPVPDVQILVGDCMEVLAGRPADSVDLIVTSPPYADQRDYARIAPDDYVEWFLPRAEQFLRVLKPTGSFVLNIADKTENGFRHPYVYDLVLALQRETGFLWAETYFWAKGNPMPGDFGKRAVPCVEYIYWFAKTPAYYWDDREIRIPYASARHLGKPKSYLREPNGEEKDFYRAGGALPPNFFDWTKAHVSDGAGRHPAVFPIELPLWFIRCGCPPGGLVCDPFAGSGTTGLAARRLERSALLIEAQPHYARLIAERLKTEQVPLEMARHKVARQETLLEVGCGHEN